MVGRASNPTRLGLVLHDAPPRARTTAPLLRCAPNVTTAPASSAGFYAPDAVAISGGKGWALRPVNPCASPPITATAASSFRRPGLGNGKRSSWLGLPFQLKKMFLINM